MSAVDEILDEYRNRVERTVAPRGFTPKKQAELDAILDKYRTAIGEATERETPIKDPGFFVSDSGDDRNWQQQLMIGTPSRGQVRIEWHAAMRSIIIPANWYNSWYSAPVDEFYPIRFTVAHAQNAIVKHFLEYNPAHEWLLLLEDDVIPPPGIFMQMDEYLKDGPPIVSGLYFLKGIPSEPLVYRGLGNGAYTDWKVGDRVWADGVPTGCLLIHRSILQLMYDESREYVHAGLTLREVFIDPRLATTDLSGNFILGAGTSDLEWCRRIIKEDVLKRAGWSKIGRKRFPYLVDTAIFCRHITSDGVQFPP